MASPPSSSPALAPAAPSRPAANPRWQALTPAEWGLLAYLGYCELLLIALPLTTGAVDWLLLDGGLVAAVIALHVWVARLRPGAGAFAADVFRHAFALFFVLPFAYQQAGSFGTRFVPLLENRLLAWDRVWFGIDWLSRRPHAAGGWGLLFEAAYLSNYVFMLLTLILGAALPFLRRPAAATPAAGRNWSAAADEVRALVGAMIVALLLCYAVFPFFPAVTPRLYFPALRHVGANPLQALNWALLGRFSIPYGIFPSGHVAGPAAVGAMLAARRWRGWAVFFLIVAVLIAVATVYGNYHFASDAVAGFAVGLLGCGLALALGGSTPRRAARPARALAAAGDDGD